MTLLTLLVYREGDPEPEAAVVCSTFGGDTTSSYAGDESATFGGSSGATYGGCD